MLIVRVTPFNRDEVATTKHQSVSGSRCVYNPLILNMAQVILISLRM